jgi:3-isopropylmalate/(R)-2-methylmalate dehydratase small subunit
MDDARLGANARITVDLERQVIVRPNGEEVGFSIDPHRRRMLLEGLDEIGQTLGAMAAIESFEARRQQELPWIPSIPLA